MSLFFSNPELIRNARIQLRPGRMIAAAIICAVISIAIWASIRHTDVDFSVAGLHQAGAVFALVLYAQVAILLIGGGIYCLQSVHREKELNTFDFQRVTRLTSLELAVGKLFGAPIGAYFVVLCLMPVALIGAVQGRVPATIVAEAYFILFIGSIAYHALALLVSVVLGRAGGFIVSIFAFLALVGINSIDLSGETGSPFLSVHAISPFAAGDLISQYTSSVVARTLGGLAQGLDWTDVFLGKTLPHLAVLMILYATFTAWFLLGITRNFKRDPAAYEVFSPNQAFAFVLYLSLLVLGFYPWAVRFREFDVQIQNKSYHFSGAAPNAVEQSLLGASLLLFAMLALILLRNRERVRVRIRQVRGGAVSLLAALWPAPYLVVGIAVVGGAIIGLISRYRNPGYWDLKLAVYEVAFLAVWLSRDALYLQWMNLRRVRRPLAAAALYLVVFYGSTGVVFSALDLYRNVRSAASLGILVPSPLFVLNPASWSQQRPLWLLALAAQAAEAAVFGVLHWTRLREFEQAPTPEPMPAGDLPQHA